MVMSPARPHCSEQSVSPSWLGGQEALGLICFSLIYELPDEEMKPGPAEAFCLGLTVG